MSKVLITGGSRGIGAEIAKKFAIQGVEHITLSYLHRHKAAEEVAEYCERLGVKTTLCQLDLTHLDDVRDKVRGAITKMGGVDILVNNAGITDDALALRMTEERWESVLHTNLTSPFFLSKIVLKPMIRQRYGRIINISSVIAQRSRGGQSNYAASKGALESMTRALAVEVASRGITVNAVAPGWIDTELTAQVQERGSATSGIESTIPAARTGKPEEVAALVGFLASKEASYITGQVVAIDGGLSVRL